MTHSVLFPLIILAFFYQLNRPSNDMKSLTFLMMFEYANGDKISLIAINNKSTAHQEDILSNTGPEANPVFSNKISRILANINSTADHPDFVQTDVANFNVTFDEKAREDAFEKKPAAESPHAVKLLMRFGKQRGLCSGTLLTVDWVLTAAHCLTPPKNIEVVEILVYAGGQKVGNENLTEGSQLRSAKSILPHPNYTSDFDNDIGLLLVNESFRVTDTVRPTEISTQPWDHVGYRECQMTGFGQVQIGEESADDGVRKTHTLEVKQPCLCSFRLKMHMGAGKVSRYICARPRQDYGVCSGDSGAGLVCDGKIRGVAMQIMQLLETTTCQVEMFNLQCGSPGTLSIFQDSCPYVRWVNSHVRMFNDSQISGECVERSAASRPLRGGAPYIMLIVLVFLNTVNTTLFTS